MCIRDRLQGLVSSPLSLILSAAVVLILLGNTPLLKKLKSKFSPASTRG